MLEGIDTRSASSTTEVYRGCHKQKTSSASRSATSSPGSVDGAYALAARRMARRPAGLDRKSCPCQPFSVAGKQKGFADERHLWPVWFNLIRQCIGLQLSLESRLRARSFGSTECALIWKREGYAIGAAVLPACAVDAPTQARPTLVCGPRRWCRTVVARQRGDDVDDGPDTRRQEATGGPELRRTGLWLTPRTPTGGDSLNEKPRAADCTSSRTK
jgi:hypothetical protein